MHTVIHNMVAMNTQRQLGINSKLKAKNMEKVSSIRSLIGAQQNRLEHTVRNGENTSENTAAAESRIRDMDMAEAMVLHAKFNILEQAGQALMSQANRMNEGILRLLNI